MPVFFEILLYFTTFGTMVVLFGSVASLVIWPLKAFWTWAAEPETDERRSRQFQPVNLDHLKRAGQ